MPHTWPSRTHYRWQWHCCLSLHFSFSRIGLVPRIPKRRYTGLRTCRPSCPLSSTRISNHSFAPPVANTVRGRVRRSHRLSPSSGVDISPPSNFQSVRNNETRNPTLSRMPHEKRGRFKWYGILPGSSSRDLRQISGLHFFR